MGICIGYTIIAGYVLIQCCWCVVGAKHHRQPPAAVFAPGHDSPGQDVLTTTPPRTCTARSAPAPAHYPMLLLGYRMDETNGHNVAETYRQRSHKPTDRCRSTETAATIGENGLEDRRKRPVATIDGADVVTTIHHSHSSMHHLVL